MLLPHWSKTPGADGWKRVAAETRPGQPAFFGRGFALAVLGLLFFHRPHAREDRLHGSGLPERRISARAGGLPKFGLGDGERFAGKTNCVVAMGHILQDGCLFIGKLCDSLFVVASRLRAGHLIPRGRAGQLTENVPRFAFLLATAGVGLDRLALVMGVGADAFLEFVDLIFLGQQALRGALVADFSFKTVPIFFNSPT